VTLAGSVNQLVCPKTAHRLFEHNPGMKLIVMLRNPVERAFSAYLYNCKRGIETLSFEKALSLEETRLQNDGMKIRSFDYFTHGFYYDYIIDYLKYFPIEQFHFIIFENLKNDKEKIISDTFRFLDVDSSYVPYFIKVNETGEARIPSFNKLLFKDNWIKQFLRRSEVFNTLFPLKNRIVLKRKLLYMNTVIGKKPMISFATKKRLTSAYRQSIIQLQELINRDLSHWLE
jgi:hypothetical protein